MLIIISEIANLKNNYQILTSDLQGMLPPGLSIHKNKSRTPCVPMFGLKVTATILKIHYPFKYSGLGVMLSK